MPFVHSQTFSKLALYEMLPYDWTPLLYYNFCNRIETCCASRLPFSGQTVFKIETVERLPRLDGVHGQFFTCLFAI